MSQFHRYQTTSCALAPSYITQGRCLFHDPYPQHGDRRSIHEYLRSTTVQGPGIWFDRYRKTIQPLQRLPKPLDHVVPSRSAKCCSETLSGSYGNFEVKEIFCCKETNSGMYLDFSFTRNESTWSLIILAVGYFSSRM